MYLNARHSIGDALRLQPASHLLYVENLTLFHERQNEITRDLIMSTIRA